MIGCAILIGCSGCDSGAAFASVKKKYLEAEVRQVPGRDYDFLVRMPNGAVRYCWNSNSGAPSESYDVELFPACK